MKPELQRSSGNRRQACRRYQRSFRVSLMTFATMICMLSVVGSSVVAAASAPRGVDLQVGRQDAVAVASSQSPGGDASADDAVMLHATTGTDVAHTYEDIPPYEDIPHDHFAALDIAALAVDGILTGTDCGPGRFCPETEIQRWQFAVWVARVLNGAIGEPARRGSRFIDIEGRPWWEGHVERLAELGVTQGCGAGPARFCPYDPVTRAQIAAFIDRALDLPEAGSAGFIDTAGVFSVDSIDRLYHAGISRGCSNTPLRYCPDRNLSRAQMAALLNRGELAKSRLNQQIALDRLFDEEKRPSAANFAVGRISIPVYICAASSQFSNEDLADAVGSLNRVQTPFFERESNGKLIMTFTSGKVISRSLPETGYDCEEHIHESKVFLVLSDSWKDPNGDSRIAGYAVYGEYAVAFFTSSPREPDKVVVAHELGHAVLRLCHTFEVCQFQGTDQNVAYSCNRINRCDGNDRLWHLASSLMSWPEYGSISSSSLSDSHIACSQRVWLNWTDSSSCEFFPTDPPAPPDPPSQPRVTSGDGQVTVDWVAPDDNGSAITRYEIAIGRTGWSESRYYDTDGSATSITITGLENGFQYEVRIRAFSANPFSGYSSLFGYGTAEGPPPDQPSRPRVTSSDGQVTVDWVAPDDNGSAITYYEIEIVDDSSRRTYGVDGSSTSTTITGLENGFQYEVRIRAYNAASFRPSDWSNPWTSGTTAN